MQYITGTPMTLLRQTTGTSVALCPSGLNVIGGGFTTSVPPGSNGNAVDMQVFHSVNSGSTIWSVSAGNLAQGGDNRSLTLVAFAICATVR